MGADLAPYSAGQARRQQAYSRLARDRQRADVHSEHRLPMAGDSERPAAALDPARLLRSVELGRHSRSHPSRSLCRMPRKSRARGLSHRRRSEEHTSELQSRENLVCRLLLEKKKKIISSPIDYNTITKK